jgi:hypothetical protein
MNIYQISFLAVLIFGLPAWSVYRWYPIRDDCSITTEVLAALSLTVIITACVIVLLLGSLEVYIILGSLA